MLDIIVKNTVSFGAALCASKVMGQVFNAVLPEASTIAEKAVQVAGRMAVGAGVAYAVEMSIDNTVNSVAELGKMMKQMNKKDDCVVE